MSTPTIVCGPLPSLVDLRISSKNISGQDVYSVVQDLPLWPNNSRITVSFFGGTGAQKALVEGVFAEYTIYANVNFVFVKDNSSFANIRIAFSQSKAWSAIGKQALMLDDQPTMVLGSISKDNSSNLDRAIVLHEVGHALGLEHEWDGRNVQLVDPGRDAALAQHAQLYAEKAVSNFLKVDNKSVMSYFLPAKTTRDGRGIAANSELSDADKAWLVIHYPGRSAISHGVKWNLLQALDTLNVPPGAASRILSSKQVSHQRAHYSELCSNTWGKQTPISTAAQSNISRELQKGNIRSPAAAAAADANTTVVGTVIVDGTVTVDTVVVGTGTGTVTGSVANTPANSVTVSGPISVTVTVSVPTSNTSVNVKTGDIPGTGTGTGVVSITGDFTDTNTVTGTFVTDDSVSHTITVTGIGRVTITDTVTDTSSSDILAAVLLHPHFQQTVTKIAESDLSNRYGVNLTSSPIQNSAGVSPEVQQGILGILLPILTQLAGGVISGVSSQNGIQANAAYYPGKPLPPDVQQGIFDVVGSILKNPAFTSIVAGIAKGVLAVAV